MRRGNNYTGARWAFSRASASESEFALPDRQCPQRTPHGWHVEGSDKSDPPMGQCAGVTAHEYTRSLEAERDALRSVVEQVRALAEEPGSGFPYVQQHALLALLPEVTS